ncbi:thiol-disulfide oxidoreductase ResA [Alkalihalophilus lindianensis]|uniref:Thiol-disulfide oxidoreductase ResA n=1 Tax=Alkalihalophilus lindianensis TaxID=1630542 RepID=A0ABU3XEV9_9BACI|nr:thiol-disulfide oxidoreductase ResA [Alkalihalophilus lindianensis]MDV2686416.1 thiol-disulfide oxidoreductase ResA [Alkalihalophilus lindianensis]
MRKKRLLIRTSILLVITVALSYTFYFNFTQDRSVIRTGDKSINFILEDLEGQYYNLYELEGKGVFINFWGTYCPECVKEMPLMDQMYQEYKSKGIEVLAINVGETQVAVERFTNRLGLSFPILIDYRSEVVDAYGISPLPTTVLIDENGIIVDVYTGPLTEEITRNMMGSIIKQLLNNNVNN